MSHPFSTASDDERALVEVVWEAYLGSGDWPLFDYVRRALARQRRDGLDICSRMRSEGGRLGYTWIWGQHAGLVPQQSDKVVLTIAGLQLLPSAEVHVAEFLGLVRGLAGLQLRAPLDPTAVSEVIVDAQQFVELSGYRSLWTGRGHLALMQEIILHEPATWGGRAEGQGDNWTYRLPDSIDRYADAVDLDTYYAVAFGSAGPQEVVEVIAEPSGHADALRGVDEFLHPTIEQKAGPQFAIGEYEHGVFVSMKQIEIRVRALAGLPNGAIGVALMNQAFGPAGSLTDPGAQKGEQEGTRALFAGAYAVLRNPAGHREVDYSDSHEAIDAVHAASLLMRILDRVEARLRP